MIWIANCFLITFGALWPFLMLVFDESPIRAVIGSQGSFVGPLILLLALCRLGGASRTSLLEGLSAGVASAALSGPVFSLGLFGAFSYAISAALVAWALFARRRGVLGWTVPIAAASQSVALILLARRQFGVGNSVVEADYAVFWPIGFVWVAIGLVDSQVRKNSKLR